MDITPDKGRVTNLEAGDCNASAVARDAPLMAVGKGQYAPLVQGRPVLRADGTPLVIGVR